VSHENIPPRGYNSAPIWRHQAGIMHGSQARLRHHAELRTRKDHFFEQM